jgi:uncharacterized protein involved in exopolysaccharide biosynthesis
LPEIERPAPATTSPYRPAPDPATAHADSREFEDELDIGRHLRIFAGHPLLLLSGALLGAVVGLLISTTRPVRYEAVTALIAHLPLRAGGAGVDRATLRAFMQNQTLATEVLQELELNRPPHDLTPQRFTEEALRVEESAGTNLFYVRVQLADPEVAAEASRRIARKAVALNKQVASDAGAVLRNELKPHLEEAAARLQTTAAELVSYQREAQIELLEADSKALIDERGELFRLVLDIESERARVAAAEKELRGRPPMLSAERLPRAEEALRHAGSIRTEERRPRPDSDDEPRGDPRRAAAGEKPTPPRSSGKSTVVREAAALDIEKSTVDPNSLDLSNPLVNPVYQTLEFQLATSRARHAALERHRAELERKAGGPALKELTSLYQRQVELSRRQNDYDIAEQVFEDISLRHEKSRTDLLGNSAYLQIIDEAVRPDRPMPRQRVQTIALGLLCGLILAAGGAVILESSAASARELRG